MNKTIILVRLNNKIEKREIPYSDDEEIIDYIKSNFKEFDEIFTASISERGIVLNKYYYDTLNNPSSFVLNFDELCYLFEEVSL